MHRLLFRAAGLLLLPVAGLALAPASAREDKPIALEKTDGVCGSHGTRVDFRDTPREAAKIAKKEEKLVFVLHVSGNFEDPRFT